MGRNGISSALLGLLAASTAMGQTTDTTTTTTTDATTVVATTLSTAITTVIDSTTTTLPITTVVSTTITLPITTSSDTTSTTTAETTVITTSVPTSVTTVIDSTTTVVGSTTETVTTVTVSSLTSTTSASSTTTSSGASTTTTNAPQYTGATFHIESTNGDLGEASPLSGATRKDLIFDVRSEYTIDGFGHLIVKSDGYVVQTNAGSDTVYADVAPAKRSKRQAVGTALTCSVATTGVLACTGAAGSVFYTDGTNLYLGAAVPAGFTPITLIAVIDAPIVTTSSSTVAPTGPLPTSGPTTPVYAGWGQWSYPQPTGVPVALTTVVTYPVSGGLQTQTVTVTSLHCGCTETPLPTKVVMTTYVTECPEAWGYTAPVTVVVPVKPTGAVWGSATASGSTGGDSGWITYGDKGSSGSSSTWATYSSKPAANTTWSGYNSKPYTGAATPVAASAGLLSVSVAMLAFFL